VAKNIIPYVLKYMFGFATIFFIIFLSLSSPLLAQDSYPSKSITIIVPCTVGGGTDQLARLIGQKLSLSISQLVLIENHPGASNVIGMNYVAKAPADGYVLGLISPGFLTAPIEIKKSYEPIKDFSGVAFIGDAPLALVANPNLPFKDLKGFISYAKSHPGKLNWASLGSTSTQGLAGLDFENKAHIKGVQVQYKGSSDATRDLLGGNVQYMFNALPSMTGHIASGDLTLLGITGSQRSGLYPQSPLISEIVPNFNFVSWFGFIAPVGTPPAVVDLLNQKINAIISTPDVKDQLISMGIEPRPLSPGQLNSMLATNYDLYRRLIEGLGIRSE
jgi:tripartite-type tricarboxylate transporter receptor subunit TctC